MSVAIISPPVPACGGVMLTAALGYAEHGWYVHPLEPRGKKPITGHGFKDATTDPEKIKAWWKKTPNANIGIACGPSGVVVLDLDPRNGYLHEHLENELEGIITVECMTGGDGHHLYFQHPGGTVPCASGLRPGVDRKSDGGYVVAPPSIHPSGNAYVWEDLQRPGDVELAPCPAWLLNDSRVKDAKPIESSVVTNGQQTGDGNREVLGTNGTQTKGKGCEQIGQYAGSYTTTQNPEALAAAVGAMLRIGMADGADGSKRLLSYACRAVENDLSDEGAVAAIRLCERLRPFPKAYSDADIVLRIRQAEKRKDCTRKTHNPGAMETTVASTVVPEKVSWLWRHRIAYGKLTLLTGDPGLGKSFASLDIASRVSRGVAFPDNLDDTRAPGNVIILSAEDGIADTIVPRLISAQADLERIAIVEGVRRPQADGLDMFNLEQDLRHLEETIKRQSAKLVIIDPLSAYFGCNRDSHKDAEVRSIMAPLSKMVERLDVACLCVAHLNKQVSNTKAVYRSMGSLAFVAAVRSTWMICKDKDDPKRLRLMLPVKNNLAPVDLGGLRFHIESTPDGAVVQWHEGEVDMSADEGLTDPPKRKDSKASRAEEWLTGRLQLGPVRSDTLEAEAKDNGTWKKPYYDARSRLGIKTYPVRDGGRFVASLSHIAGHERMAEEIAVSLLENEGEMVKR